MFTGKVFSLYSATFLYYRCDLRIVIVMWKHNVERDVSTFTFLWKLQTDIKNMFQWAFLIHFFSFFYAAIQSLIITKTSDNVLL